MKNHVLQAHSISVHFGDQTVLDDVDLEVRSGVITGVAGPSGSGKTTLLRVVAGLQTPDAGTVTYNGAPTAAPGSLAMIDQHPRQVCNPRWTLAQIITEPADIAGRAAHLDAVADRVGLDPDLLTRFPTQVSGGQLQRACLARVLIGEPAFLLCDEPTAMLDPIATTTVVTLLRELSGQGTAIAIVSHDPTLLDRLGAASTLQL
ncbi:ABC transporter ATP-binding protein [Williamsia sp.]|uniref:ABC transporter ATP-binding protein n=1 Tax=Williamsia sp. TaxID=1872085 RepID=UPI002F954168